MATAVAKSNIDSKRLFAVSFGHFSIDIINASIPIILTAVAFRLDLTVSQIGLAAMIYTFAASLTQPLFGILTDRLRGRHLAGLGLLWTMIFYSIGLMMPSYPALVACLTLGALGSGAFHPAGMINATVSGGRYPTMATSIFFVLGQTGLALGPLLAGFLVEGYGVASLRILALAGIPAIIAMFIFVRHPYAEETDEATGEVDEANEIDRGAHQTTADTSSQGSTTQTDNQVDNQPINPSAPVQPKTSQTSSPQHNRRSGIYIASAFILLIIFRSTTQQSFTTLLPKYFSDMGFTPAAYGSMVSILAFAGATGTFAGGWLGDRFNRRIILFVSMLLGGVFSYMLLHVSGWLYAVAALSAGFMMNIPHSILLIMAQRLLPKRRGMIGGAVLGLMFASGAAMAGLGSWIAEFIGLPLVLGIFALLPLGGALCALLLPPTRGAPITSSTPKAAAANPSATAAD